MADYGFELGDLGWVSRVDSTFANYSLIKEFTAAVSAGVNTISIQVAEGNPLIAVRHPGVDIGFLRLVVGNPTKVVVYANRSGTVYFKVFTPSQRVGEKGHGLMIFDTAGREVYHSDLFYLDVNSYLPLGSTLDSGYYILGSHRGLRFVYTESSGGDSWVVDNYGWVEVESCSYSTSGGGYVCPPGGTWLDCYLEPIEFIETCTTSLSYQVVSSTAYSSWWYKITLKKYITCVRHSTDDKVSAVEHAFSTVVVLDEGGTGSNTYDGQYSNALAQHDAISSGGWAIGKLDDAYNPVNATSQPNKLLYSKMKYA